MAEFPAVQHTDHALLVGLGMFGRQIGLFEALDQVRFPGRTYKHAPQRKLRELLAALAAGYRYLQDIDFAADAIGDDLLVVVAWDEQGFVDHTGVGDAMRRADATTVADLRAALERVSMPFLMRDVEDALATGEPLRLEGDTTGVATTADMLGVAPGLIEGRLQPGFHMASVSVHTPANRVMLGSAHFSGSTVSSQTLETLVGLAEQRVGRPRRRVELLYPQLAALDQEETDWHEKAQAVQERIQKLEEHIWALHFQIQETEQVIQQLKTSRRGPKERRYSQLNQARQHLETYQRWQTSARGRQSRAQQTLQRFLERAERVHRRRQLLQQRIARYEEDNRTNPHPLEMIFSTDGGFGTPSNVARLIEAGYDVLSKAHGRAATPYLLREVTPDTRWEPVNSITQATESARTQFGRCPYPARLILTCQQRGEIVRHSTLVIAPPEVTWGRLPTLARGRLTAAQSVCFYNSRQDIEAGIKEFKGVFFLGHMRFFSTAAIQIQEQLITFLPNFIRWAIRYYFRPNAIYLPSRADHGLDQLKNVVGVAMHSKAEIHFDDGGCVIRFEPSGAFAGLVIDLRQPVAFQPPLPLFAKLSLYDEINKT